MPGRKDAPAAGRPRKKSAGSASGTARNATRCHQEFDEEDEEEEADEGSHHARNALALSDGSASPRAAFARWNAAVEREQRYEKIGELAEPRPPTSTWRLISRNSHEALSDYRRRFAHGVYTVFADPRAVSALADAQRPRRHEAIRRRAGKAAAQRPTAAHQAAANGGTRNARSTDRICQLANGGGFPPRLSPSRAGQKWSFETVPQQKRHARVAFVSAPSRTLCATPIFLLRIGCGSACQCDTRVAWPPSKRLPSRGAKGALAAHLVARDKRVACARVRQGAPAVARRWLQTDG